MTPGARVEAAIGLLAAIDSGRAPADDIVGGYFRRHRFAGAKDRGAISEHIYAVLRHRAALDWWIERQDHGLPVDARRRLLAGLALIESWTPEAVAKACDGDRFRPAPLDAEERQFLAAIAGKDLLHRDMPAWVRGNYPAWLSPYLEAALGRDLAREMAAMQQGAQLDLRVNLLKSDRDKARAALAAEGVKAMRTPLSPIGLRIF